MLSVTLRVAGIGDGLFVIMFVIALAMLVCFFGFKTNNPGVICFAASAVVGFFILLFWLSPKGDPPKTAFDDGKESPETVGRWAMFGFMLVGTLLALVMLLTKFVTADIKTYRLPDDRTTRPRKAQLQSAM
jgi:hypothetical protein